MNQFYAILYGAHTLAVDTFFMMGALLASLATLSAISKKSLSVPRMILHRFLRYTPALAALILFAVSLYKFILSGPVSDSNNYIIHNCQKYWIPAIFHIQNYFNQDKLCLSHTWYLSLDFQLFIATIFLLYPAMRYGWRYFWIVPSLAVASSVCAFFYALNNVESKTMIGKIYEVAIYHSTHTRIGPWMIGVVLGYILHVNKERKNKFSRAAKATGWILASIIFCAVMIAYLPSLEQRISESPILCSCIVAFHRSLFSIAIAWLIFACHKLNSGGIIKYLLELPYWQPIGERTQLRYSIFYSFKLSQRSNGLKHLHRELCVPESFHHQPKTSHHL